MDIDKILRGQLSATDVLLQQAEGRQALIESAGVTSAFDTLDKMNSLHAAAMGVSSAGLLQNYLPDESLVSAAAAASRAFEGVYSPTGFAAMSAAESAFRLSLNTFAPALPDFTGLSAAADQARRAFDAIYSPLGLSTLSATDSGWQNSMQALRNPFPDVKSLSETMRTIMSPWPSSDSMSEILAGIGQPYPKFLSFHDDLAQLLKIETDTVSALETVRRSLGDWRDQITFPPLLELKRPRLEFYAKQGVESKILRVAVEDGELHEFADAALLDDLDDSGNITAYRLLLHLEHALRKLISLAMEDVFGPHWWKRQVPNDVRVKCEEKLQDAVAAGAVEVHPIDYADFTDYAKIICRTDNFPKVFQPIFGRSEDVRESLQRLHPVRLICMHSRLIIGADLFLVQFEAPRILAKVKPHLKKH